MRAFEYFEPTSIEEALSLLSQYGGDAKLIAGGTDLIVQIKQEKMEPKYLISLKSIPGLDGISVVERGEEGRFLSIGALATHRSIERCSFIRRNFCALADAADVLGSVQVRNVATIGGNLCNAAPSADTAAPLLALDARLRLVGPRGERVVGIEEFYLGPGRTVLAQDEILKEILLPVYPAVEADAVESSSVRSSAYVKHSRRKAMDLPLLGVAVSFSADLETRTYRDVRIALAVAAPTPMRAREAEREVEGSTIHSGFEAWYRAGQVASVEARPRTSLRATEEYRREMIRALVPRAAAIAIERAGLHCHDLRGELQEGSL